MKNLVISTLVLASLFVGCKSSGGICCDAEGEEQPYVEPLLAPVAVMDNRTIDGEIYPAIALSGARSYDRDESNQSIVKWDWNITSYDYNNVIVNTDPDCTKTFSGVDVNVTYDNCQQAIYTIVKLTVTDDEHQTDTAEKNISILY